MYKVNFSVFLLFMYYLGCVDNNNNNVAVAVAVFAVTSGTVSLFTIYRT